MKRTKKQADEFLKQAHERFETAMRAEGPQRERWLEDLRFEAGEQWPEYIRRQREKDPTNPRPCLVVNKTQTHIRQVVNDIRQNRPQIKVLPVDGNADPATAEILSGHIRNIENVSDLDIAIDCAVHPQVSAGIGYIRIITKMADARLNQQEICFLPVWNPLSVYLDPETEHPAGQDAQWAFVVEDMPEDAFKKAYPNANTMAFRDKGRGDGTANWYPEQKTIRVAEYYYIQPKMEKFYEDAEGQIFDEQAWMQLQEAGEPVSVREQRVNCCYWAKITGAEVLEETEVPTQYVPIIRVAGMEGVIDGERDVKGLVRDAKDPARMYNYWSTLATEMIALAPKAPFIGAAEAFEGFEDLWDRANVDNIARLPYNHLDAQGQPIPAPQRAMPPQQSTAIVQAIIQADQDLMSVMGRFEASMGEQGNEKSGRAIIARQRQGDNATFHFSDNLSRALRFAGRILLDMIPKVYDTKRMVRLMGEDGSTDFAEIDPAQPKAMVETQDLAGKLRKVYNIATGKYDAVVITGPSYATKRQEAAEMMAQLTQADPTLMQKAGDIIVKGYDLPLAEDLSKRLKAYQPPEVQQAEGDGEDDPQAQIAQAVQASQQQMMAEIQPAIEEMQTALQTAEQEAAQKDMELASLKQQLANREQELMLRAAELNLKREEMQMKAEGESAKGESEIVRMVLEKALMPEPEPERPEVNEDSGALQAMIEQMNKPKRKTIRLINDESGMPVGAEVIEE